MFTLNGKYASASVKTMNIEEAAKEQVIELLNSEAAEGSSVAIMPDVHAGKGCTIGTVMTIADRVVPNLVGVDIGCGVYAYKIPEGEVDFAKLQATIEKWVPAGRKTFTDVNPHVVEATKFKDKLKELHVPLSYGEVDYIANSLGTLGGGNHFISVERGEHATYLLIHSGSRHLGQLVAKYHQKIAEKNHAAVDTRAIIEQLKAEGREKEIATVLKGMKKPEKSDLAYLTGSEMDNYLEDMKIAQKYAHKNRDLMARIIFSEMGWGVFNKFECIESVHNYIDLDRMILRKGAVAAYEDEFFLVPLNMRDGTLIYYVAEEKEDWLMSAPHGAGRTMSRSAARKTLNMEDFKTQMEGIWTATVQEETLDEAPGAYKPAEEIKEIMNDVYMFVDHLKPVFNFKATE